MRNDPRYHALRRGLDQLTTEQLRKVLAHPAPMCFDTYAFDEAMGRF